MASAMIRCVPTVLQRERTGEIIPAVRFVDPDLAAGAGEFFTVSAEHIDGFIDVIRKAKADAEARGAILRDGSDEDRRLLTIPAGGAA